jgi:hypothetical protein
MTLGPVFVTVLPAKTAKFPAVPSPTGAWALMARGTTTSDPAMSRTVRQARRQWRQRLVSVDWDG